VNDTIVTVVGNVVDSPRRVSLEKGAVTNFRMASTARRYDTKSQEFVDSGTFWVDVECWDGLSGNVSASISKGDPVIVHGAMTTHSWESENGRRSSPRIRAFVVGPNLAKGRADFKRDRAQRTTDPATEANGPDVQSEPKDGGLAGFPGELLAGRDYVADDAALDDAITDALSPEPANV
jgi:single-strand DNA-binding protein